MFNVCDVVCAAGAADMLWTAPELLTSTDDSGQTPSTSADIYSLGVVLQEILLRSLPYQTGNEEKLMHAKGM